MNVKLSNIFSFLGFSSSNLKCFGSYESFDKVSFVGKFAFISSNNSEPAASFLIGASNYLSIVAFIIFEDAQTTIVAACH